MSKISRREFLKLGGVSALSLTLSDLGLQLLDPVDVTNPLAAYPDRGWEQIYRDQYSYDSSFTYVCSERYACLPPASICAQWGHPAFGDEL
jgi:nitrate reductase alpha subunit